MIPLIDSRFQFLQSSKNSSLYITKGLFSWNSYIFQRLNPYSYFMIEFGRKTVYMMPEYILREFFNHDINCNVVTNYKLIPKMNLLWMETFCSFCLDIVRSYEDY